MSYFIIKLLNWIVFLALFLMPYLGISQKDSIDLFRILELAQNQTFDKQQAQNDLEIAQLGFELFRGSLKPRITGFANFPNYAKTFSETTQPDGTIQFQPIRNNNSALGLTVSQAIRSTGGTFFLSSNLQRFDDLENSNSIYNGIPFRLGLIQPIFAFNPLKWDNKLQPLQLEEARQNYIADMEMINFQTVQLFFDLLEAYQELEIAQINKKNNQNLIEIAQEEFELGKISNSDLLQLELELTSAKLGEKTATQSLKSAYSNLNGFLSLDYDGSFRIPVIPQILPMIEVEKEFALKQAQKNRPDYIAFLRNDLLAKREVDKAKKENGLSLDLNASIGFSRSASNISDIYLSPQQEQFLQLQIAVPILDWNNRSNQVEIANISQRTILEQNQRDKIQLENQVKQMAEQFNSLQSEVHLAKEILDIANEKYEITRSTYLLGAISLTDLTFAQRNKDAAKRSYVRSLRRYWSSYYELRRLTLYDFDNQTPIH